jgi:hypothetical protein
MKEIKTTTFHKGKKVSTRKCRTLGELLSDDPEDASLDPNFTLTAGQLLVLGIVRKCEVSGKEFVTDKEEIWIGDTTPYIRPTTNDGGIGWSWNDGPCTKHVLEIHTFR